MTTTRCGPAMRPSTSGPVLDGSIARSHTEWASMALGKPTATRATALARPREATTRRCAYPYVLRERTPPPIATSRQAHGARRRIRGGGVQGTTRDTHPEYKEAICLHDTVWNSGFYDTRGHRKYVTTAERTAFLTAAEGRSQGANAVWAAGPYRLSLIRSPAAHRRSGRPAGGSRRLRDVEETPLGGVSGRACAPHTRGYARPRAWPPSPPGA